VSTSTFDRLKRFAGLCEEEATARGLKITVTILDAAANPVVLHRMPGAGVLTLEMAERKAYTSGAMGVESKALAAQILPGQPGYTLTSSSSRLIAFGGGTFVRYGDDMFGIGISGGPTEVEDMDILAAAQDRFGDSDASWAERVHPA